MTDSEGSGARTPLLDRVKRHPGGRLPEWHKTRVSVATSESTVYRLTCCNHRRATTDATVPMQSPLKAENGMPCLRRESCHATEHAGARSPTADGIPDQRALSYSRSRWLKNKHSHPSYPHRQILTRDLLFHYTRRRKTRPVIVQMVQRVGGGYQINSLRRPTGLELWERTRVSV